MSKSKDGEINKQKPHLKWSREARRGNSHAGDTQRTLLTLTEERYPASLAGPRDSTVLPQQEEQISPCPVTAQSMGDHHNSANEKAPHFELPVSIDGLFPPKSIKEPSCPLCLRTATWFSIRPYVLNRNSLLFPNKSSSLEMYLFKVNRINFLSEVFIVFSL